MKPTKINRDDIGYPAVLANIASPPRHLYCLGLSLTEILSSPAVAIVGSRKVSSYGQQVTFNLASELANKGIVIISGLAIGVDAIAHDAAIRSGGKTIAVLGSGLKQITPPSNFELANRILDSGGAIISEYPPDAPPFKSNFIARNRIVSGLSQAVLITEAAAKSGSLYTANFALEQGREVCVVPGNINSPNSVGTNSLIKTGATVVTDVNDILNAIGIKSKRKKSSDIIADNEYEYILLTLINNGVVDGQELLLQSGIGTATFNQTLTMLEISGKITSAGNGQWHLK